MTTLIRRLARPGSSPWRWLGVNLQDTHRQTLHLTPRDEARLLAGGGRSLAGCSYSQSRKQHTEAAAVEVDLKRLDGEDDGRDSLSCHQQCLNSLSQTQHFWTIVATVVFVLRKLYSPASNCLWLLIKCPWMFTSKQQQKWMFILVDRQFNWLIALIITALWIYTSHEICYLFIYVFISPTRSDFTT